MIPKKMLLIIGVIIIFFANIIILAINSQRTSPSYGPSWLALTCIAPFQRTLTGSTRFMQDIWNNYFNLVSTAIENDRLKKKLSRANEINNFCNETRLSNLRLRDLLELKKETPYHFLAAEVISRDPSIWFKTVIIDKGLADGIQKGFPVIIPDGIIGQIIDVSAHYAKVLLIVDRNSSVDALVQKTRARGIIKGGQAGRCLFKYVLRKHDISIGDIVISSGLDGVFPKGLRIGSVSEIIKLNSGIFQTVAITPYVDFERLEEVFVVASLPHPGVDALQ